MGWNVGDAVGRGMGCVGLLVGENVGGAVVPVGAAVGFAVGIGGSVELGFGFGPGLPWLCAKTDIGRFTVRITGATQLT